MERNLPRSEQKLLEWIRPYVSDWKKFYLILDPRLDGEDCIDSAQKLALLASKCLMKNPKFRPKMSEVVEMLGSIISETLQREITCEKVTSDAQERKEDMSMETGSDNKQGNNHSRKKFDIREIVNLRTRSIGKLDWRNWTPGLVRTW